MAVVLVIDDDRAHAEATGEIVRRLGHEVRLAFSGEEGIEGLHARDVDLVVTDLVMSDRSGLDVIAAAQGGPDVIVVTGFGSKEASPLRSRVWITTLRLRSAASSKCWVRNSRWRWW